MDLTTVALLGCFKTYTHTIHMCRKFEYHWFEFVERELIF